MTVSSGKYLYEEMAELLGLTPIWERTEAMYYNLVRNRALYAAAINEKGAEYDSFDIESTEAFSSEFDRIYRDPKVVYESALLSTLVTLVQEFDLRVEEIFISARREPGVRIVPITSWKYSAHKVSKQVLGPEGRGVDLIRQRNYISYKQAVLLSLPELKGREIVEEWFLNDLNLYFEAF